MERMQYPDIPEQLRAIQEMVAWASGCRAVWVDTNEGGDVREAGEVWLELRLRGIEGIGVDETIYVDLEAGGAGPLTWPAQECVVGLRLLRLQVTARSRKQNFDDANVAWYAAAKVQSRIRYGFARDKWLNPFKLALVQPGSVLNMPMEREWDDRVEDYAVLEPLEFSALLSDSDTAALCNWIERIEASTGFYHAGLALDDSLQLDDEVIP